MTSADDAALIQTSLERAATRSGDLTAAVYERLFAERPELEPLFVMDSNGAVRGEMLARTLEAILDFIGERVYAHHMIHAEASNHHAYNVPREAFSRYFAIVVEALREACGGWDASTGAAWERLLAELDGVVRAD